MGNTSQTHGGPLKPAANMLMCDSARHLEWACGLDASRHPGFNYKTEQHNIHSLASSLDTTKRHFKAASHIAET